MTRLEKRVFGVIAGGFFLLIILYGLYFWWEITPPKRPANVPATGGYYSGLALPFITSKDGDWVYCWFDAAQNVDECQVTFVDGKLYYEGVYLPYPEQPPIPQDALVVDSKTMDEAQEQLSVPVSVEESFPPDPDALPFAVVPFVYLRDGNVLLPAKAYDAGKKRLLELQAAHSPYAPAEKTSVPH